MVDGVRDAYDARAAEYAALALSDLDRPTPDAEWLARFATLAAEHPEPVADLGCGPGHVVDHLTGLGVPAVGYDITPGLVAQARLAFPDLEFHVADISALQVGDASFGGIVARYSLIHMPPESLGRVFQSWRPLLTPGGPLLVSFFAAPTVQAHGTAFDHAMVTAYALHPATIASQLEEAGFTVVEIGTRGPLTGERALDHATVLAGKPAAAVT